MLQDKYQRLFYFYPISEFDILDVSDPLQLLTGDVDLCAPYFDLRGSIWGSNYICFYNPSAKTLILSIDDGQPLLQSLPLTSAQ